MRTAGHRLSSTLGASPRPRKSVKTEMALQMNKGAAADSAQLSYLERPQRRSARQEPADIVELTRQVDRDALIPPCPVELDPVLIIHRSHPGQPPGHGRALIGGGLAQGQRD
jgi:hypothetical protein